MSVMDDSRSLDARRASLSEDRRALLSARLRGSKVGGARERPAPIPRRLAAGSDLLSFAQRRLWFLDRLVPGSAFYTESSALRIRAPLSVPAFEMALNEIV